jgi:hypothetical protein
MSVYTAQEEAEKLLLECEKLKLWVEASQVAPADTTNELKKENRDFEEGISGNQKGAACERKEGRVKPAFLFISSVVSCHTSETKPEPAPFFRGVNC